MDSKISRYKQLKAEISALQQLADEQKHHYKSSKELLYEGLSRLYMLWMEANKETGLLEKLYKEYNLQYKSITIHEIQFSPLLRYLWNMDGSINSNKIDMWNRALNKVHAEVQLNKPYFTNNTLNKLTMLIDSKGGVSALAGYAEADYKPKKPQKKKTSKETEQKLKDAHLTNGKNYFAGASPLAAFKTNNPITSIDSGITLALLRKTNSGYEVISAIDDDDLVSQSIISAYKRTSEQMPHSIRLLTEIIRSQTLPTTISTIAASIASFSDYKVEGSNEKMKQLKRLLYVADKGVFILSENRTDCSVVTTARPIASIFKKNEINDIALAVNDRTFIENNLIHTDDFNFYTTDSKRYAAKIANEPASYKMKLENTVTKDYRFIRFYKLSTFKFIPSRTQAAIMPNSTYKPTFKVTLNKKWLEKMNVLFLMRWIKGFGMKMKRDEHKVIQLACTSKSIAFDHIFKADKFKESEIINFDETTKNTSALNIMVLSKDIVPVLNALVTMEINGNVVLTANEKMLQFKFTTDCAEYSIAVPCCDSKNKRVNAYMEAYGE